jgi:hypothetical protein
MKKSHLKIVLLFVLFLYSCRDDNPVIIKKCNEYFIAQVDSVSAPDTVLVSDTLIILMGGYLGPNGCYSFHKFEHTLIKNDLSIWVRGQHNWCIGCIQIGVGYWEYFKVNLQYTGLLYVNIHKPDGSVWKDSVYVRQ